MCIRDRFSITWSVEAHSVQQGLKPLEGVSNLIAVASGKGGVGKSTTSVNLALALSSLGKKVGLMDADIYGPSLPRMMGIEEKPKQTQNKRLLPPEKFGSKCMSMGMLVDEEEPVAEDEEGAEAVAEVDTDSEQKPEESDGKSDS